MKKILVICLMMFGLCLTGCSSENKENYYRTDDIRNIGLEEDVVNDLKDSGVAKVSVLADKDNDEYIVAYLDENDEIIEIDYVH